MPKKNDDLFGELFAINGDGCTDAVETALMFMMFDEIHNEIVREQCPQIATTYDIDDYEINGRTIDLDDMDIEGI